MKLKQIILVMDQECKVAEIFQPIPSGLRSISSARERRSPLPGDNRDKASNMFVLPAPLEPNNATGHPDVEISTFL